MRKSLRRVSAIFVQDNTSVALLNSIGITAVSVSGDTRFDRVWEIRQRDNSLDFMQAFKGDESCMVAGSTWPEDEELLAAYINRVPKHFKYVIVPHDLREEHLAGLKNAIGQKVVCFSELGTKPVEDARVLIIDTIGLLTRIYSYADIAYVGGAFATGLHNTLEPAVFGVPVITGPNYAGFREAEELVGLKGLFPVDGQQSLDDTLDLFANNRQLRERTGQICADYVKANRGATGHIMAHIHNIL